MKQFDAQITFCRVRDLAVSARFYEDKLGLKLALDQGTCRIYRVTDTAFIGFCCSEQTPCPDGVILTLVTREVDACHRQLKENGILIEKEPVFNPDYNITHCFFRDPDGYLIEIQRFEDPVWNSTTG